MTNCARAGGCAGSNYPFLTQKERDFETGLDYFLARYYGKIQGRFFSPDPTLLSVNGFNPQSWNRYVYVLINPLFYVDPLGLWEIHAVDLQKEKKNKDGTITKVYDRTVPWLNSVISSGQTVIVLGGSICTQQEVQYLMQNGGYIWNAGGDKLIPH